VTRLLRRALALVGCVVGAVALWEIVLDRLSRQGRGPDPVMRMTVVVHAPIERVWAYLADIERQPEWMREMKEVRLVTPGPVGAGARGEATVRIAGVAVTDPVTVEVFDPPRRFGIRHEGLFGGGGLISLVPLGSGTDTAVHWEERLVPPILPYLGTVLQRPVLSRIFQADMDRMRDIVESGADAHESTGPAAPAPIEGAGGGAAPGLEGAGDPAVPADPADPKPGLGPMRGSRRP
jgi:hypothetical protein